MINQKEINKPKYKIGDTIVYLNSEDNTYWQDIITSCSGIPYGESVEWFYRTTLSTEDYGLVLKEKDILYKM